MAVFSRIFKRKPRIDATDAAERLAALEALDDEQLTAAQQALATMASEDQDPKVRAGALARLEDPTLLARLLAQDSSGQSVARRVLELLEAGRLTQGGQAGQLAAHPAIIRARLRSNPTSDLINQLLASDDTELLLDAVLICHRDHRAKLLEHPLFAQSSLLTELERRSRDHDKRTNRFARGRLDEIRTHRHQCERLIQLVQERLVILEKPIEVYSNLEVRKRQTVHEALDHEMAELVEVATELAASGEAVDGLEALTARHAAIESTDEPGSGQSAAGIKGKADNIQGQAEAQARFENLTQAFATFEAALLENADFEALTRERQSLTEAWLANADLAPPTETQHATFERVSRKYVQLAEAHARLQAANPADLDSLLEAGSERAADLRKAFARASKTLARINWPEWTAPPEALLVLQQRLSMAESKLAEWQGDLASRVAAAEAGYEALTALIDAGELKKAKAAATELRAEIQALPGHQSQSLGRQLAQASARLSELSDWQTYATSPKREALCDAMEALATTRLSPRDQAARIKTLRAEWNELGPVSRAADRSHLTRFNELAEAAFEPCRTFFAEQAEERTRNLASRSAICDTLTQYLADTDWASADFKAAEQIMRTARKEWQTFHPVDRTPGKPVEERFEALQAELHEHIKAEWTRNVTEKEQIVAEAEALVGDERDARDKVSAAIDLQQRWKRIGLTPRRPDQDLWRQFRKACDQIFEARDQAQKSADDAIDTVRDEARALLDRYRQWVEGDDPLDAAGVREYQQAYQSLTPLPDRLQRAIDREFRDLTAAAEQALRDARSTAARQKLLDLAGMDADVSALELRHRNGEEVSFEAPDRLFADRWAQVDNPVPLEDLQRLLVEAEIAAGIDSEESHRELRLVVQVELMNSGRSREALDAAPDELAAQWCRIGPKDDQVDLLRSRFFAAIEKLSGS